jgi:hypothetical protein
MMKQGSVMFRCSRPRVGRSSLSHDWVIQPSAIITMIGSDTP